MTRQDFMNRTVSYADYYRSVYTAAGLRDWMFPKEFWQDFGVALTAGDEHLNTIPLSVWEEAALFYADNIGPALKKHGDFYSLAGAVCTIKQFVIDTYVKESAAEADGVQ